MGSLHLSNWRFRSKLSTGTALAHFTDNVLQNMDAGSSTGAVFLDLSKAFDTVDHPLLLQKLTNIGLATSSTQWFRSYLTNRSQITSVGDAHSASTEMPIGVPQGSILEPLLFLITWMIFRTVIWQVILFFMRTILYSISTLILLKIKLFIHATQDVLMIFAYPYPEQTGVNKLLFFTPRKTGTAF